MIAAKICFVLLAAFWIAIAGVQYFYTKDFIISPCATSNTVALSRCNGNLTHRGTELAREEMIAEPKNFQLTFRRLMFAVSGASIGGELPAELQITNSTSAAAMCWSEQIPLKRGSRMSKREMQRQ